MTLSQIGFRGGDKPHLFGPVGSIRIGMSVSDGTGELVVTSVEERLCARGQRQVIGWLAPVTEDEGVGARPGARLPGSRFHRDLGHGEAGRSGLGARAGGRCRQGEGGVVTMTEVDTVPEVVVSGGSISVPAGWTDAEWNALLSHRMSVLDIWMEHQSSPEAVAVLGRIPRRDGEIGGSRFTVFLRPDLDQALMLLTQITDRERSSS